MLFLLASVTVMGQRRPLSGVVMSGKNAVSGVYVINKSTGDELRTDNKGQFSIMVQPGDYLAVYSKDVEARDFLTSEASFVDVPYRLSVVYKPYELDEVTIDKNNTITAEGMGIVPKGQKKYTQQERKLYTASSNKPVYMLPLGLLLGSMPLDPIFNAINGKTRMLKRTVVAERDSALVEKLNSIYTEEEIELKLKVPEGYAKGFVYYAVTDKELADVLASGNDNAVKFLLTRIADEYRQLITNE